MQENSVAKKIISTKDEYKGALIGYIPAGFPDIDTCVDAAITMLNNGVDILELGIPYSDPVMDGPIIQNACNVALSNGFKVKYIFDIVKKIRQKSKSPILIMSYWNIILQYGLENFVSDLLESGADGIITPDLITDEALSWIELAKNNNLSSVFLAAQTSSLSRLEDIYSKSTGMIYAVSTMGITGLRSELDNRARDLVAKIKQYGDKPVCVGIGVTSAEHVSQVLNYADGAIVGSAFVNSLSLGGVNALAEKTKELAAGKKRIRQT